MSKKRAATSKKSKKGAATSGKRTATSKKPSNPQDGGPVCRTQASLVPPQAADRSLLRAAPPGGTVMSPQASVTQPHVRFNYLIPADRLPREDFRRAINNAAVHVQRFYAEQLGGSTFMLHDPVVEVFKTGHNASFYSTNPAGQHKSQWFFNNVTSDAFAVTGGKFFDDHFIWIYYIDAEHDPATGGGAGTSSVAALPRQDLDGLLGAFNDACRWVGGLGHELGHALGLNHPAACDANPGSSNPDCRSLMFLGYPDYPDTFFTEEHRAILSDKPFIMPVELTDPPFDCADGM
jgi:hypothetical protein